MNRGIVAILSVMGLFSAVVIWNEIKNPCVEYGPERLKYIHQVGNIMLPAYGRNCILR